MQKIKTHTLSNSKILEILNSGENTYSANQAEEISKSLIKFSQLLYKYWNEESKREKGNSISKS
jgi:hypothetical protein